MQSVRRLYDSFHPEHYAVTFNIIDHANNHTFSVTTTISGDKVTDGPLRLHAKDLTIEYVVVNREEIFDYTIEGDELVIPTTHTGTLQLTIRAKGTATDGMHGIYPCHYELNGVAKELLATQFESHHAREAFPCIDEPAAKATFDVTLITQPDVIALSNMPAQKSEVIEDAMVTTFDTTPRMSTYLLAFVVGDLQNTTATTKSGVEVSVYATPVHSPETLEFARDWTIRSIEFFEEYFDIPYPLPQCNQLALPDFSASAMENWGLVTYREAALLVDPKHATAETQQSVANVIAHEISHQWFGNLVTMRWWNDLWLNESFANLMSYIACDNLEPSWNVWEEFSAKECALALRRDALDGVQSVKMEVNNPDEIGALFDHAIVYAKGSRLLRMLHDYIGDEAFRGGLRQYFANHSYDNTTESDLWNALGSVSGKDIASFMTTWLTHPGYPLVSLTDGAVSQQRFFIGSHADDRSVWPVPLLPNVATFPRLLESATTPTDQTSVILNISDGAHFITNYNSDQLNAIIAAIASNQLSPLDTLRLINEQSLLVLAGHADIRQLLPLLQSVSKQTNLGIWQAVVTALNLVKLLAENDTTNGPLLRKFVETLTTEQYARLGWKILPNEPVVNTRLRPIILEAAGYAGNKQAMRAAHASFELEHFVDMEPTTRAAIAQTIVHIGIDDYEFTQLLDMYRTSSSPELQRDLVLTLTATRAPEQITLLVESLTDGTIRPQDIRRWVPRLLASAHARDITWRWIRDEWGWIVSTFKGDMSFDAFPTQAGHFLTSQQHLDEYREFFKPWQNDASLQRAIALGDKEIEATVAFIAKNHDLLTTTLRKAKETLI